MAAEGAGTLVVCPVPVPPVPEKQTVPFSKRKNRLSPSCYDVNNDSELRKAKRGRGKTDCPLLAPPLASCGLRASPKRKNRLSPSQGSPLEPGLGRLPGQEAERQVGKGELQRMVWNSGERKTAQSRSSTPSVSSAPSGPGFSNRERASFRSEPDGSRVRQ